MKKSALKKAYKQTDRPMGVYGIRCVGCNTVWLGYGTDVQARINRHKTELKFGNHRNSKLQQRWNASGETAFEFAVLDLLEQEEDLRTDPAEELQILAEMWIQKLEKAGNGIERL